MESKVPPTLLTSGSFKFVVARPLRFVGTNAYWLSTLNTDVDIDNTLGNMASAGIKVVRVWAFNGTSCWMRSNVSP
jgi:mannan endo-1,4-beta-mannosidase